MLFVRKCLFLSSREYIPRFVNSSFLTSHFSLFTVSFPQKHGHAISPVACSGRGRQTAWSWPHRWCRQSIWCWCCRWWQHGCSQSFLGNEATPISSRRSSWRCCCWRWWRSNFGGANVMKNLVRYKVSIFFHFFQKHDGSMVMGSKG